MHCPMCDAVVPDDAQFCIICGAAIESAQTGKTQRLRRVAQDMLGTEDVEPPGRIVQSNRGWIGLCEIDDSSARRL